MIVWCNLLSYSLIFIFLGVANRENLFEAKVQTFRTHSSRLIHNVQKVLTSLDEIDQDTKEKIKNNISEVRITSVPYPPAPLSWF